MSERILLGHGSGGKLMHELLRSYFLPQFSITEIADAAILDRIDEKIALTINSYVVTPLFFRDGNIGELAVNGTVNDLSIDASINIHAMRDPTRGGLATTLKEIALETGLCINAERKTPSFNILTF